MLLILIGIISSIGKLNILENMTNWELDMTFLYSVHSVHVRSDPKSVEQFDEISLQSPFLFPSIMEILETSHSQSMQF